MLTGGCAQKRKRVAETAIGASKSAQTHVITAVSKAASDQQVTEQVLKNFRNNHLPAGWTFRVNTSHRKTWRDGNGKTYKSAGAVEDAILSAGAHQPEEDSSLPSQTEPDDDSDEYDECDENDKKVLD